MIKPKIFVVFGNMNLEFTSLVEVCHKLSEESSLIVQAGHSFQTCIKAIGSSHEVFKFMSKEQFSSFIKDSDIVIAHAGVGVLTDCLHSNKKPVLLARSKSFGEHTNDHQLDFLEKYKHDGLFHILENISDVKKIVEIATIDFLPKRKHITDITYIIEDIRSYINSALEKH
jgi:UDP-N-acetylglucosamine transferase subunit ALG13